MKSVIIRRNEFKKYHQDSQQPTVISKRIYRRKKSLSRQRSNPIEIASNKLVQQISYKRSTL